MRALSAAVVVLAGALLVLAEILTVHLHPDRWGLMFGLPLIVLGLGVWLVAVFTGGRTEGENPPLPRWLGIALVLIVVVVLIVLALLLAPRLTTR
jgi:uncharacterized membrane protein YhdT